MKKSSSAFTMIELVFVIVVLGILSAIAIPKLSATRTDAQISKGRADIASIRSAILSERQSRLITGDASFISKLHSSATAYFDGNGSATLLMYAITPKDSDGHWHGVAAAGTNWTYKFKLQGADTKFTYTPSAGTFTCDTGARCSELTD